MVPALVRGLRVLELMAEEESELTLKSISERLVIPVPSLWRILSVLRENGYVIFDREQKTYRLEFDLTNERYDVEYDPGTGSYTPVETVNLKNNIEIESTTFTYDRVSFDSFVAPSEAGEIVLKDTTDNAATVSIAAATGKVVVE